MNESISSMKHRTGPPLVILGVPFDNVTSDQAVAIIEDMVNSKKPHYLATANVDFTVQALKDPELRHILLEAHMVVCDGMPLVWASKWLGNPLPERVAGSDLVPLLLGLAEQHGWRVFFLGGTPAVLEKAMENIRLRHPGLQLAGALSPPFKPLQEMDHQGLCATIRAAKPDLLFVSFGCPKQEKWIAMNYGNAGVPVNVGVGATIDFLAGSVKRAPVWMQRCGIEWIFRMLQEPRRLMRRYGVDLWIFGRAILRQLWLLRRRRRRKIAVPETSQDALVGELPTEPSIAMSDAALHHLPARLDAAEVQASDASWLQRVDKAEFGVIIDASAVTFIDSTGVGMLVRLLKRSRESNCVLVLLAVPEVMLRALRLMRLDTLFSMAETADGALQLLLRRRAETLGLQVVPPPVSGTSLIMTWAGEVSNAVLNDLWTETSAMIDKAAAADAGVTVDLAAIRFIDSGGVGLMVRLKKYAQRKLVTLHFVKAQPSVQRVVQLLQLEDYLMAA